MLKLASSLFIWSWNVSLSIKFCNSSLMLVSTCLVNISLPTAHSALSTDMHQYSRYKEAKPFEADNYLVSSSVWNFNSSMVSWRLVFLLVGLKEVQLLMGRPGDVHHQWLFHHSNQGLGRRFFKWRPQG